MAAKFYIKQRDGEVFAVLVDEEDLAAVLAAGPWYLQHVKGEHTRYVRKVPLRGEGRPKHIRLHRLLLDAPAESYVDHINGNGLDNRRANLRLCTNASNQANQKLHADSKSGVKGVYRDADSGRWRARIQVEGRRVNLGGFADLESAKAAYQEAARKYFGDFANPEGAHAGR